MKFWIRILISFAFVVVIAFGIWAFFLREKDDVKAYNQVCDVVDFKESLAIDTKLDDLRNLNYLNNDETLLIDTSSDLGKEINRIKTDMLSKELINIYNESVLVFTYDSYYVLDDYLDKGIESYLSYLKYNSLTKASNNAISKASKNYVKSLVTLKDSINFVTDFQNSIKGEGNEYQVLKDNYQILKLKYKACLNDGAKLLLSLLDAVRSEEDNFKCDTNFALTDGFARALKVSTQKTDDNEVFYADDMHKIVKIIDKNNADENFYFDDHTKYGFLNHYTKLITNYTDVINLVLDKHTSIKKQMADNEALSEVKIDAQESIVYVLNVLGF